MTDPRTVPDSPSEATDHAAAPGAGDDAATLARGREYAAGALATEADALAQMARDLPEGFDAALSAVLSAQGRVVVGGMGKSGHIARKMAATFASTGTPAHFVHPAEASHGDLGMIGEADIVMLLSNSGDTRELGDIISYTRRFSIPLIAVTKRRDSTLARAADIAVILPDAPEACGIGMVPTTSTTMALALGDALAVAVMRLRGYGREVFHTYHPGGKIGAQFLQVRAIMHQGAALPEVRADQEMSEVLLEMTGKGFGIAAVTEAGQLVGVITDGDLRRHLTGLMDSTARQVATPDPRTIGPEALISEAVLEMNRAKVNALCVVEPGGRLVGLVRLHDCLKTGVV
ncbi:KpsF/GutQ family sugar-phosphate isomerase [Mesobaculum littorinae]|uniref:KpsF/GutQ family sugar-phosphate isomerase n=2 Tax=Mesobaculum littorinae TaxID=2486419 RepID=A0A438AK78_9RHOB|nr:KpsF/GutQ family sugar-phosphate isomerase [Mesobaculum littorinae]RVV99108.1 KpsF/GutQ family sugar-phosphate isomerase [Mesobaculum littorinae]